MNKIKFSLRQILEEINDFRNPKLITHDYTDVLLIVIVGVLSGIKCSLHIAHFAKYHKDWFRKDLRIRKIPSHDTIDRILNLTNFRELETALTLWLEHILKDKQVRKHVAIDGKKIDKKSPNTTTFVRAFIPDIKMVIAGQRISAYSNEIVAIPKLIKKINLKGYFVTIDAIGTQASIAQLLVSKEAHYVLPVKRNQKMLYEDIMLYAESELPEAEVFETKESSHGRNEIRRFYAFNRIDWLIERHSKWRHIKSFGLLKSYRKKHGETWTRTIRIFISSCILTAQEYLTIIRSHWKIENNLHWPLNQSFEEHKIRSKSTNFIINFSSINSFCLTLLHHVKAQNISFNLQKIILTANLRLISKILYLGH